MKSAEHLKMAESIKKTVEPSASTSFVACYESDIKPKNKDLISLISDDGIHTREEMLENNVSSIVNAVDKPYSCDLCEK